MKRFVTVVTFTTRVEAEVAKGFLESNGINASVVADDLGGTYPYPFQPTVIGVKLQVAKEDLKKAALLLSSKERTPERN